MKVYRGDIEMLGRYDGGGYRIEKNVQKERALQSYTW